mmetsp:Transcript_69256/g.195249  ORF Transcript_69256/g.195249 Transcript_69256/m.195249 type:complete len:242 (-) Transcript_69256:417-1142(-)
MRRAVEGRRAGPRQRLVLRRVLEGLVGIRPGQMPAGGLPLREALRPVPRLLLQAVRGGGPQVEDPRLDLRAPELRRRPAEGDALPPGAGEAAPRRRRHRPVRVQPGGAGQGQVPQDEGGGGERQRRAGRRAHVQGGAPRARVRAREAGPGGERGQAAPARAPRARLPQQRVALPREQRRPGAGRRLGVHREAAGGRLPEDRGPPEPGAAGRGVAGRAPARFHRLLRRRLGVRRPRRLRRGR